MHSSSGAMIEGLVDKEYYKEVENCGIATNLARGALLRILSDLSGGTPLESIKCRVTVTKDNMFQACKSIIDEGSFWSLWQGTHLTFSDSALVDLDLVSRGG